MPVLDLPSEVIVEIATYLGTTRNLANFKMTCTRIYSAIESEKVDRKRLPHLKIREVQFSEIRDDDNPSQIRVGYRKKNEDSQNCHTWDYSDPLSPKFHILIRHSILEDNCKVVFWDGSILEIPLLESLSEINYGNAIECQIGGGRYLVADPSKAQQALPFIHEFLKVEVDSQSRL